MATKAAGTLTTTNNATYANPAHLPTYKGHTPTYNQYNTYGENCGNKTQKYFQDYRLNALSESRSRYAKGGEFPMIYTFDPTLVMKSRLNQERPKSRTHPNWDRYTNHFDRTTELKELDLKIQRHRDYYRDKTWCRHRESYFVLPVKNEDFFTGIDSHIQHGWPDAGYRRMVSDVAAPRRRRPPVGYNTPTIIPPNISLQRGPASFLL